MSLRRKIKKILEASEGIDSEHLEGAYPAFLPSGGIAGGLIFVATKNDPNNPPQYEKYDQFTLLNISTDPSGKKVVQMNRNSDGANLTLPASSPFKLYGSQLKKDRDKKSKSKTGKKTLIDKGAKIS
jgi:hypothetical protein